MGNVASQVVAIFVATAATIGYFELPETVGRGLPEELPRPHKISVADCIPGRGRAPAKEAPSSALTAADLDGVVGL